jgi:hypothetical protein
MADLNQNKISPKNEPQVKKQLDRRRNKEQKHAQFTTQMGGAITVAGSLAKKLGQGLGSEKLTRFGAKAEATGREAQAIGQEATNSKYIKETVNQRNAARNVNDEALPAGAPLSNIASPLNISEDERAQELLDKKSKEPSREYEPTAQLQQPVPETTSEAGARPPKKSQEQPDEQETPGTQEAQTQTEMERERKTGLNTAQRAGDKNQRQGTEGETGEETVRQPMAAGEPDEKGEATATALAAQIGSAEILKFCWLNGWYIVPLLYVNIHGIIKYTCNPSWLCEFGEEWTMEKKAQEQAAALATGEKGEANPAEQIANTSLKWVEIIGIIVIDILIAMTIVLLFYALFSTTPWYIKLLLKLKGIIT